MAAAVPTDESSDADGLMPAGLGADDVTATVAAREGRFGISCKAAHAIMMRAPLIARRRTDTRSYINNGRWRRDSTSWHWRCGGHPGLLHLFL